jgi:hypothetical protein
MSQNMVACWQLKKLAPSSAFLAEARTNLKIAHSVLNASFHLMGLVKSGFHPMKECPQALL